MSLGTSHSLLKIPKGVRDGGKKEAVPDDIMLPAPRLKCINVLPRFSYRTGYENLNHLVKRANLWLSQHRNWEVRTCESLPYQTKAGRNKITGPVTLTQLSTMRRSAPDICFADHITYLRLWVVRTPMPRMRGHKIMVYTVLPKPSHTEDGLLTFTNLSKLLEDINSTLRHTWPSNFEILTVETLQTTFDRGNAEESEVSLTTTGLRIFVGLFDDPSYPLFPSESRVAGTGFNIQRHPSFGTRQFSVCESIGLADFAPKRHADGTLEDFSELVARASRRCSTRDDIRITNIQAVDIRLSSEGFMDTTRTYFYEDPESTFVRIVRVAYVVRSRKGTSKENLLRGRDDDQQPFTSNSSWSCRHFYPRFRGLVSQNLETIEQVVGRINAWLGRRSEGEFIAAESCLIPVDPRRPWWAEIEMLETCNTAEQERRLKNWLCVIRVYVTGDISEAIFASKSTKVSPKRQPSGRKPFFKRLFGGRFFSSVGRGQQRECDETCPSSAERSLEDGETDEDVAPPEDGTGPRKAR